MVEQLERSTLAPAPYQVIRALEPISFAERYLALHRDDHSCHVAYRFTIGPDRPTLIRLRAALATCSALKHEHLLGVESTPTAPDGAVWAIAPFTGDVDGLRSLGKLLREKSGQMGPFEAERALVQILEAMAFAHRGGGETNRPRVIHGSLAMEQVLVDRHGSLLIELYGLPRALAEVSEHERNRIAATESEAIREEIRSVVEIGYQLITGLRAEEPLIPASRLVKRLDPRMDRWLTRGLSPSGGFATAPQALAELPIHNLDAPDSPELGGGWGGGWGGWVGVRNVLDRIRFVRN